ncbi:GntR family transcriptional regulator [Sanguibacter massiliensis]|uniref:GntR family transcriptional regulator n=1 Tax=Sanguibacter massiliensis TaxID=1973217 RepID=UPI001F5D9CF1|nr:GntR family transcriptional regulator [Sanguibacter massiliensis]
MLYPSELNPKGGAIIQSNPEPNRDDAALGASPWHLTAALSPRRTVRVAAVDAYGEVVNTYSAVRRTDGPEPTSPWAIYLAGDDHRFRYLCFDLDAKGPAGNTRVAEDTRALTELLEHVGLDVVVCESGPGGGRHVWTALAETVDADVVATLARLARHICPTLDLSCLTNAATGCVRPPGSPHRKGGRSTILRGDVAALLVPQGTSRQVASLVELLAARVHSAGTVVSPEPHKPLPLDEHARIYLPGARRDLPAVSAAALREDAASGDASAVAWRILIGAAAAHWRFADVAELVDRSPGLEHIRTERDRGTRTPRTRLEATRILQRQWDKAVRYVASTGRQIGDDPTFDARAGAVTALVRDVQTRADAAGGRWVTGGGPADRRVLDVVSLLALEAVTATVEADIRRVAMLAGIGRETVRTALHRLAAEGWIVRAQESMGARGAQWTIDPQSTFHRDIERARSQADPRPAGAGSAERATLLATLADRTTASTHDVFAPAPGLGALAGNVYGRLSGSAPLQTSEVAALTGMSVRDAVRVLGRLEAVGLAGVRAGGWRRAAAGRRDAVSRVLNVDGLLARRQQAYAIERELWAWWQAEDAWMRAPRRTDAKRRAGRGQLSLLPEPGTHAFGAHPRTPDGRLNWREARRILIEDRSGRAHLRGSSAGAVGVSGLVAAA